MTQPAAKLAKRKGWTQYIDVSAIDPLTLSVQILRNIHGGGERLTRKLTIAQLELRRTEIVKNLRAQIGDLLLQMETLEKGNRRHKHFSTRSAV
ncbi:MAG: hypothetical protein M3388_14460 [Acidobacteriota bacterium]|nr:hypothetical protein [Acidobacteriota bacterium]